MRSKISVFRVTFHIKPLVGKRTFAELSNTFKSRPNVLVIKQNSLYRNGKKLLLLLSLGGLFLLGFSVSPCHRSPETATYSRTFFGPGSLSRVTPSALAFGWGRQENSVCWIRHNRRSRADTRLTADLRLRLRRNPSQGSKFLLMKESALAYQSLLTQIKASHVFTCEDMMSEQKQPSGGPSLLSVFISDVRRTKLRFLRILKHLILIYKALDLSSLLHF